MPAPSSPPPPCPRRWHHIILTTYGAWLPGDPRGFRTRHHREHVEGDYKNPPPEGTYTGLHASSKQSLDCAPTLLTPAQRAIVGAALHEKLASSGHELVCIAVGGQHVHLQVKLTTHRCRLDIGLAKKHAWFALRESGWNGRLWGKRCKAVPIRDRSHQMNVYRYILAHAGQGAWVWTWKQSPPRL